MVNKRAYFIGSTFAIITVFVCFTARHIKDFVYHGLFSCAVTGLHDIDEYIQAQLLLAVSRRLLDVCVVILSYRLTLISHLCLLHTICWVLP